MLKEITIKNFMSINKEITFSMEADINRVGEHSDHIVAVNKNNILKVSSMYGTNGGGKSNLLKAITLPKLLLNGNSVFNRNSELKCLYSENDNVEETIFFINDEFEIGYSFEFTYTFKESEGYPRELGLKEISLNILNETVSYRVNDSDDFVELLYRDKTGMIESSLTDKILLPQLGVGLSAVMKIYNDYANNEYNNDIEARVIRSLYSEIHSINDFGGSIPFYEAEVIGKYKNEIISSMNNLDIEISDIRINENSKNEIYFEREVNVNGKIKKKEISLNQESTGTRKIFDIIYSLVQADLKGFIYVVDDLDSYLHPKIFKAIIELFNSKKNISSQLIFNSHDVSAMNNKLFRRDEIWFAYRDDNYSTEILPLSNIVNYKGEQVRKDAKYNKQYLEGRYGANPFIKNGLDWYEH